MLVHATILLWGTMLVSLKVEQSSLLHFWCHVLGKQIRGPCCRMAAGDTRRGQIP
jgi:hypothetical protein